MLLAMKVYLPMSYVWGVRGTAKRTPLTDALRQELYPMPYETINWDAARNQCAKPDLYYPHPKIQVCSRGSCCRHLHHDGAPQLCLSRMRRCLCRAAAITCMCHTARQIHVSKVCSLLPGRT